MNSVDFANCHVKIDEKGFLTATIDLNKPVGLSNSEKSINYGLTNGNQKIVWKDKILNFGVNCYSRNPKYVQTEEDKARMKEIYGK